VTAVEIGQEDLLCAAVLTKAAISQRQTEAEETHHLLLSSPQVRESCAAL
jgi:hypothetical protein